MGVLVGACEKLGSIEAVVDGEASGNSGTEDPSITLSSSSKGVGLISDVSMSAAETGEVF